MTRLKDLIAQVESANSQWAMRFEPHVYKRTKEGRYRDAVAAAREANKCSWETARVIVSCSWGFYQIMGFNIYGFLKFKLPVCEYVANRTYQDWAFDQYVGAKHSPDTDVDAWTKEQMVAFGKFYNGPGDPGGYADRMAEELARLQ